MAEDGLRERLPTPPMANGGNLFPVDLKGVVIAVRVMPGRESLSTPPSRIWILLLYIRENVHRNTRVNPLESIRSSGSGSCIRCSRDAEMKMILIK